MQYLIYFLVAIFMWFFIGMMDSIATLKQSVADLEDEIDSIVNNRDDFDEDYE